jgi:ankyrin repeat protein
MKFLKYFESNTTLSQDTLNQELMSAIDGNDIDKIRDLLIDGADVNYKERYGQLKKGLTPLHKACNIRFWSVYEIKKNEKVMKLLIKYGADLNAIDSFGRTPLMFCEKFHKVKILLDAGADFFIENNAGKTYLDIVLDELTESGLSSREEEFVVAYKEIMDWFNNRYPHLIEEWYLRKNVKNYNL